MQRGFIKSFSLSADRGVISGDDGTEYPFLRKNWLLSSWPRPGTGVMFGVAQKGGAINIILADPVRQGACVKPNLPFVAAYRSSDNRILGGVCAGAAHHGGIGVWRFRLACLTASVAVIPVLVYLMAWIILPKQSTRGMTPPLRR